MAKQKVTFTDSEARKLAAQLVGMTDELRKEEAKMTEKINAIREEYAKKTALIQTTTADLEKQLMLYAKANPNIFPPDKKSVQWGSLVISKRTTPPKVGIPTGTDWDEMVSRLRAASLDDYVRTVDEVDKDGIIRAVADDPEDKLRTQLAQVGITVTQSEKVNIEVLKEEFTTV